MLYYVTVGKVHTIYNFWLYLRLVIQFANNFQFDNPPSIWSNKIFQGLNFKILLSLNLYRLYFLTNFVNLYELTLCTSNVTYRYV